MLYYIWDPGQSLANPTYTLALSIHCLTRSLVLIYLFNFSGRNGLRIKPFPCGILQVFSGSGELDRLWKLGCMEAPLKFPCLLWIQPLFCGLFLHCPHNAHGCHWASIKGRVIITKQVLLPPKCTGQMLWCSWPSPIWTNPLGGSLSLGARVAEHWFWVLKNSEMKHRSGEKGSSACQDWQPFSTCLSPGTCRPFSFQTDPVESPYPKWGTLQP